ncbi:hypothetical protein TNCV_805421 [Trichonephila clavipes]|nr:hypothetical protein TNCV_805421 [Trichonephila clavipes]
MEDLNMHRVSQHIVFRLLTTEQKEKRMAISAPSDFYLFQSMKKHLQRRHFVASDEVKAALHEAIREVAKNGFQLCF